MNNYFCKKNVVFILVVFFFLSMPIASFGTDEESDKIKRPVRLAIIPFQTVLPRDNSGNSAACPICGTVYFGGEIAEGAARTVEELFVEKLQGLKKIEIIPQDKVDGVYRRISSESLKVSLKDVLKKTGKELNVDLIAVGHVFRYKERVGYDYSVEKPASVAFEIDLLNPQDGTINWRGAFDKTQRSLMEDVLQIASFYKGGGKWLTARQLSRQGIEKIFETFPHFEQ